VLESGANHTFGDHTISTDDLSKVLFICTPTRARTSRPRRTAWRSSVLRYTDWRSSPSPAGTWSQAARAEGSKDRREVLEQALLELTTAIPRDGVRGLEREVARSAADFAKDVLPPARGRQDLVTAKAVTSSRPAALRYGKTEERDEMAWSPGWPGPRWAESCCRPGDVLPGKGKLILTGSSAT